jgi:hypothetical protein
MLVKIGLSFASNPTAGARDTGARDTGARDTGARDTGARDTRARDTRTKAIRIPNWNATTQIQPTICFFAVPFNLI